MKKMFTILLTLVLLVGIAAPAFAAEDVTEPATEIVTEPVTESPVSELFLHFSPVPPPSILLPERSICSPARSAR